MEAFTVKRDQLLRNYVFNAVERVSIEEDVATDELVNELEDAVHAAREMLHKDAPRSIASFRCLFRQGYTITLLPDSIFTRIEQLFRDNKDFAIIITDVQGEYLGVIPGRDVTW
jgi:hypothetical protein